MQKKLKVLRAYFLAIWAHKTGRWCLVCLLALSLWLVVDGLVRWLWPVYSLVSYLVGWGLFLVLVVLAVILFVQTGKQQQREE